MKQSYRSTWLCIVFVLFLLPLSAQKTEVSSAVKLNNKVDKFRILGKVGDKIIVDRYGNNIHILDIYNKYLKLQTSKQIQLEKNEFIEKIWLQPKTSWIIKVEHLKNSSVLQATKMDAKFNISQKIQVIDTIVERKDILESNLRTKLSLDESKLLIYAPVFSQVRIDYFYSKVFDLNMRLVSEIKLQNPALLNQAFVDAFLLNNGSFLYISQTKEKNDSPTFFFTLVDEYGTVKTHVYYPTLQTFKKVKFEIDNEHNALFISGLFKEPNSDKRSKNGASQFFTTKLSLNDFSNIYTTMVPYTEEFYRELTGKNSELNPPQLFTFYVNKIIPKIDGGALILTESYFKNEEQYLNNNFVSVGGIASYSTTSVYNFNDVVSYHIDSTGELISQDIIRKKQISQNDGGSYSSFYLMNLQEELKLIFLDEIDQDAHLNQASIKENKVSKSFTIMNIGSKNLIPVVKLSSQTSPTELIVPSFNKNKLQLIKVSF